MITGICCMECIELSVGVVRGVCVCERGVSGVDSQLYAGVEVLIVYRKLSVRILLPNLLR